MAIENQWIMVKLHDIPLLSEIIWLQFSEYKGNFKRDSVKAFIAIKARFIIDTKPKCGNNWSRLVSFDRR